MTEVVDDSPAAKMGVKQHDVLLELDGKRLTRSTPRMLRSRRSKKRPCS